MVTCAGGSMRLAAMHANRAALSAKTMPATYASARLPRDPLLVRGLTELTCELLHDPRADLARAERATDVARALLLPQRALHDALESLLFVRVPEVREHHA